jgi:hypothetical protein
VHVNPKEALMNTRRQLAITLVLLVALLAIAPGANASIDYSKNSASGDYAPAVTSAGESADTAADSAFDWGDAAIGAGAALVLVFMVAALRRVHRREPLGAS